MALLLFAVLFLFGATNMERRRGIQFSVITGLLLFAWSLPFILESASTRTLFNNIFQATVSLIVCPGLAIGSFFAGQASRRLFTFLRSKVN